jgi:hypothetical protein
MMMMMMMMSRKNAAKGGHRMGNKKQTKEWNDGNAVVVADVLMDVPHIVLLVWLLGWFIALVRTMMALNVSIVVTVALSAFCARPTTRTPQNGVDVVFLWKDFKNCHSFCGSDPARDATLRATRTTA